jgi:hypothetical protein
MSNIKGTYLGKDASGIFNIYAYIPRASLYVRRLDRINFNQLKRVMTDIQPKEPYDWYWNLPSKEQMLEVAKLLQLNGFNVSGLYWTSSITDNRYTTVDVGKYPPKVVLIDTRDRAKLLVVKYIKIHKQSSKPSIVSRIHNWINHLVIEANGKYQDTLAK